MPTSQRIRDDLISIWKAGVDAVRSETLVQRMVEVDQTQNQLRIDDLEIDLTTIDRIHVVGGGKASAGMTVGLEKALGPDLLDQKSVTGWVNVPADCILPTTHVHLHAARPPGRNEPTEAAAQGTVEILQQVAGLGPRDLCIALISGGGSALLPASVDGVTLADKLSVTRLLSSRGADIHQLNTVRKQLSRIKGGGLRRACTAGRLITLIISDVLGDPLDIIASGPTVDDSSTPEAALHVLRSFAKNEQDVPASVWNYLDLAAYANSLKETKPDCHSETRIIGNIHVALEAARVEAERLGYLVEVADVNLREPTAEEVGRDLARNSIRNVKQPTCLLSGGEPVVELADPGIRGKGGRNQQLVLAALIELIGASNNQYTNLNPFHGLGILSGGTDGEDGPTDAAGALITSDMIWTLNAGFEIGSFLERNDAYHFFGPIDALIRTGPTHTNVCDVRVVIRHPE